MSESSQEKFTNIIQEQQAQWMAFANKALESSMKMLEVNIRMAKQTLVGSTTSAPDLLTLKNPAEMFSINKNQLPEAYTRMLSYAKEINAITSDLNAELGKVVQSEMSGGLKCLGINSGKPVSLEKLVNTQQVVEQWVEAGKKITEAFGVKSLPVEAGYKKARHHEV